MKRQRLASAIAVDLQNLLRQLDSLAAKAEDEFGLYRTAVQIRQAMKIAEEEARAEEQHRMMRGGENT